MHVILPLSLSKGQNPRILLLLLFVLRPLHHLCE